MPTISTIRQRLSALNIQSEARESVEKTKDEVADLNRERMLAGKRADGSIMPNYSPVSVAVYGYPPGPIRLKATGAFQNAIKVGVTNTAIVQDSTDSKSEMLKARYGETIFGLDKQGKIEYANDVRPVFVKQVRDKLHL